MSFTYQDKQLICERVAVAEIAAQVGTPFYLYSTAKILENFNDFLTSFAAADATICFAVKSCSNIAILKLLKAAGAGADTVSGGEIRRARGFDQRREIGRDAGFGLCCGRRCRGGRRRRSRRRATRQHCCQGRRIGHVGSMDQAQQRHGRCFLRIGSDPDVFKPFQEKLPQSVEAAPAEPLGKLRDRHDIGAGARQLQRHLHV